MMIMMPQLGEVPTAGHTVKGGDAASAEDVTAKPRMLDSPSRNAAIHVR
jgi:hypothetical protein